MKDAYVNRQVTPKRKLGQALGYSIERCDKLSLYSQNGMLRIDNNAVENSKLAMVFLTSLLNETGYPAQHNLLNCDVKELELLTYEHPCRPFVRLGPKFIFHYSLGIIKCIAYSLFG